MVLIIFSIIALLYVCATMGSRIKGSRRYFQILVSHSIEDISNVILISTFTWSVVLHHLL